MVFIGEPETEGRCRQGTEAGLDLWRNSKLSQIALGSRHTPHSFQIPLKRLWDFGTVCSITGQ